MLDDSSDIIWQDIYSKVTHMSCGAVMYVSI